MKKSCAHPYSDGYLYLVFRHPDDNSKSNCYGSKFGMGSSQDSWTRHRTAFGSNIVALGWFVENKDIKETVFLRLISKLHYKCEDHPRNESIVFDREPTNEKGDNLYR